MAAFFTLPELRSELHALGHDDVPDHVILAFLSQLQITVPNCFKSEDRSPFDPSRPASSYLDQDFDEDVPKNTRDSSPWEQEGMNQQHRFSHRNVRFEDSRELQLQEQLLAKSSSASSSRPSTPPRCNVGLSASDSDSSKENREISHRDHASQAQQIGGGSSRHVLQPCDNVVSSTFDFASKASPVVDEYLYPGEILEQLKERQRPVSCPVLQQEPSEDLFSDRDRVRSLSARHYRERDDYQHDRHHHRRRYQEESSDYSSSHRNSKGGGGSRRVYHEESSEYSSSKRASGKDGSTSEVDHSISSLEVEEAIENFGINLKPLNLGVVRSHNLFHPRASKLPAAAPVSEDDCFARTVTESHAATEERPLSGGTNRSNCAACQLLRDSGTPEFRHFSMKKHETDGEDSINSTPRTFIERVSDDRIQNSPSPAFQRRASDIKSHSPCLSDGSFGAASKKAVVRRGKIDRVARFAEMQKVWNKDHFLRATSGKRKTQSFHRMFAEIHASNERLYAASRARSVMGVREEQDVQPFVLTT
ncbi:uncharacterized protein LOC112341383 [Selaginella moellendorffii]|uniref:uncharacterized protein LOC112341383 n=1 Tax=Selaginella moellendorffii TaxID=88036 RepID=UPI000D1CA456|nr:uncharacterized protein LOC112341383 [Selaginella moellendorffii]|eukprot:XP_024517136.1 uncharacterized protein LOC112341383 [Selaginella moellendorffii]